MSEKLEKAYNGTYEMAEGISKTILDISWLQEIRKQRCKENDSLPSSTYYVYNSLDLTDKALAQLSLALAALMEDAKRFRTLIKMEEGNV